MLAALALAFAAGTLYAGSEYHECVVCGTWRSREEFGFTWRRLHHRTWTTRSGFDRDVMPPDHRHRWTFSSGNRWTCESIVHSDGFPTPSQMLPYYKLDPVFRGYVLGLVRRGELTRARIERIAADPEMVDWFLFGYANWYVSRFK